MRRQSTHELESVRSMLAGITHPGVTWSWYLEIQGWCPGLGEAGRSSGVSKMSKGAAPISLGRVSSSRHLD